MKVESKRKLIALIFPIVATSIYFLVYITSRDTSIPFGEISLSAVILLFSLEMSALIGLEIGEKIK